MRKILFVCSANTCRSPMAEAIFKNILKKNKQEDSFIVLSKGINASNGYDINDNAKKVLTKHKLNLDNHSSSRVTEQDIINCDMVVTMTTEQKEFLSNFKNVHSLKELTKTKDILDPFGQEYSAYEEAYEGLQKALEILYEKLVSEV